MRRRLQELKDEADGGSGMLVTNMSTVDGRDAKVNDGRISRERVTDESNWDSLSPKTLEENGEALQGLLGLITARYRSLAPVVELAAEGLAAPAIAEQLKRPNNYPLQKDVAAAKRYSPATHQAGVPVPGRSRPHEQARRSCRGGLAGLAGHEALLAGDACSGAAAVGLKAESPCRCRRRRGCERRRQSFLSHRHSRPRQGWHIREPRSRNGSVPHRRQ